MKTVEFSETIAASDLKVGRSRHLIEYMNEGTISCHSNQSSYSTGMKKTIICSPDLSIYAISEI